MARVPPPSCIGPGASVCVSRGIPWNRVSVCALCPLHGRAFVTIYFPWRPAAPTLPRYSTSVYASSP
jgi:hypothetical protein